MWKMVVVVLVLLKIRCSVWLVVFLWVLMCSLYGRVCEGCVLVVCIGICCVVMEGSGICGCKFCVVWMVLVVVLLWLGSVGSVLLFGLMKLKVLVRLFSIVWWYVLMLVFWMLKCSFRKCSIDV